jgi:outer membrane receptor for ferrienterochelin and colicins
MKIFIRTGLFIIFFLSSVFSQNSKIIGQILDENDSPIAGANVYIKGSVLGSATNDDGQFQINNVPVGNFTISINVIGFDEKNIDLSVNQGSENNLGKVTLTSSPLNSSPIVVTASRHNQNIREVPVSVSTIDKSEIELRNNISIDQALQYVPGISMNKDQINIRGSSGYSRGVGSRVMMLVDGVPYITGDTQGTVPEALAINQVENVEIVKGASSALYGSSAIGGVINIITKSIDENPVFNIKLYGGLYDDPYYDQWKWSSGSRYKHGIKAGYSQKFDNTGFRIAVAQDRDDSFRKNDWSNRINLGGKLEHEFSAFDKLTISGNYMDQKRGNFLYWESLDNALVPPQSQLNDKVHSTRFFISPAYRKVVSDSNYFNINAIWFHNYFDDNIDAGNESTSDNLNLSFQYNISFDKHFLTFGLTAEFNKVSSNIFGTRQGIGTGLYIQDEIRWTKQWFTTFGARLDYFDIDKLGSEISVNPKIGVVFQPSSLTTFRSSFGTGFRAPSMAEAFTSTVASGITVIPNENLKPEKSYTAEFGWNQIISDIINTDVALFYSRYFDLIESGFTEELKARFDNVTDAEISGIDFALHFNVFNKSINSKIGYTFIEPRNITLDKSEYLKYRPRHLLYMNAYWKYKDFNAGVDYRYISKYDKIDEEFARLIADGDERIAVNVVDVQISQNFKIGNFPLKTSFQINNLLQYNYIDLIGSIAPIRNFIFSLETSL